jgi:Metallo-beta-lactamase superfamily
MNRSPCSIPKSNHVPNKHIKSKKRQPKRAKYRVRIRMYRQGLGDCILLTFPKNRGGYCHMLIDCGVVLGTVDPKVVMTAVAKDILAETKKKLDVLVITHEHWDHLSGFDENQARAIFRQIKIGALWLAWTEDETDDLARSLREERERRKLAAKAAKEAAKKRGLDRQAQRLTELLGFFGARAAGDLAAEGEDAGGTAGAFTFLKQKRAPTILETGTTTELPGVSNVRIYIVGPPKDADAMRKTTPYKGEGYALGESPIGLADAFLAAFDPSDERAQPFAAATRHPLAELKTKTPSPETMLGPGTPGYYHRKFSWRNIDDSWLATGERLALQLDSATNNTSLVLAIELENKDVLLFVGDAQAGNWRSWESRKWDVKDGADEKRHVTADELLKRTIFYKVGHHGSHNATLREKGLELMKSDRLAAFIPVDTKVAHDVKGWEHMPLPAICERLKEKCAVVFQSDTKTLKEGGDADIRWKDSQKFFKVRMKDKTTKRKRTLRKQPLYTDYFV